MINRMALSFLVETVMIRTPLVSPEQSELCNEIDDDCNGLVDEGEGATAPPDAVLFYADSDGDGFGDVNNTSLTCDAPSGYVSNLMIAMMEIPVYTPMQQSTVMA